MEEKFLEYESFLKKQVDRYLNSSYGRDINLTELANKLAKSNDIVKEFSEMAINKAKEIFGEQITVADKDEYTGKISDLTKQYLQQLIKKAPY